MVFLTIVKEMIVGLGQSMEIELTHSYECGLFL